MNRRHLRQKLHQEGQHHLSSFIRFALHLFNFIVFSTWLRPTAGKTLIADNIPTRTISEGPLYSWGVDRLVRCIFCMNYDDYNNLSSFGCESKEGRVIVNKCWGNFCYMRQHKRQEYFLYTSGCINLTSSEMMGLKTNIAALASETGQRDSLNWGNETQLCEVGQTVNTCICTNRYSCNNVTAVEPYIEYSDAIFTDIDFDELAHFRFLLPDDPILHEFEHERSSAGEGSNGGNGGNYLLVKDSAIASMRVPSNLMMLFLLSSFTSLLLLTNSLLAFS